MAGRIGPRGPRAPAPKFSAKRASTPSYNQPRESVSVSGHGPISKSMAMEVLSRLQPSSKFKPGNLADQPIQALRAFRHEAHAGSAAGALYAALQGG